MPLASYSFSAVWVYLFPRTDPGSVCELKKSSILRIFASNRFNVSVSRTPSRSNFQVDLSTKPLLGIVKPRKAYSVSTNTQKGIKKKKQIIKMKKITLKLNARGIKKA